MTAVYAIAEPAPGPIKIGISKNVHARLSAIQSDQPAKLSIVYAVRAAEPRLIERAAHRRLVERRAGGEWFNVSRREAVDAIDAAIGAGNREVLIKPILDRDIDLMTRDNWLSKYLLTYRIPPAEFATRIGMPPAIFEALLDGHYMPTLREAAQIVKGAPDWLNFDMMLELCCPGEALSRRR